MGEAVSFRGVVASRYQRAANLAVLLDLILQVLRRLITFQPWIIRRNRYATEVVDRLLNCRTRHARFPAERRPHSFRSRARRLQAFAPDVGSSILAHSAHNARIETVPLVLRGNDTAGHHNNTDSNERRRDPADDPFRLAASFSSDSLLWEGLP